jgi:hypothetical protein
MNHTRFLESKIYQLIYKNPKNNLTLPTCFEYYSAIFLTNLYNIPFNVYGKTLIKISKIYTDSLQEILELICQMIVFR